MRKITFAVCSSFILGGLAFGQAAGTKPAFEVASVKRAVNPDSAPFRMRGGPGTDDPGRITYQNASLRVVLIMAYGLMRDQLICPDWMDAEAYDIVAKVPPDATREQAGQMMQDLLIERFRMTVHHETRNFQGYQLVVGKGGSKLKESRAAAAPTPVPKGYPALAPGRTSGIAVGGPEGTYMVTLRQQSLSFLIQLLGAQLGGAAVVDKTGLAGKYDFSLGFVPRRFLKDGQPADLPDIFTAVEQQLGLKLVEQKLALDVLVIDSAAKEPIEN